MSEWWALSTFLHPRERVRATTVRGAKRSIDQISHAELLCLDDACDDARRVCIVVDDDDDVFAISRE